MKKLSKHVQNQKSQNPKSGFKKKDVFLFSKYEIGSKIYTKREVLKLMTSTFDPLKNYGANKWNGMKQKMKGNRTIA